MDREKVINTRLTENEVAMMLLQKEKQIMILSRMLGEANRKIAALEKKIDDK